MSRWIWLPVIALAGCGTQNDQRPPTVEYITEAILAPNCGNAQCHSSFRNAANYAFDTVERSKRSLASGLVGAIALNGNVPELDASSSLLLNVLTRTVDRMPYDQPLPEADIELIERWIEEKDAEGAQCDPSAGATVCFGTKVVECRPTFNYAVQKDCKDTNQNCSAGACR